MLSLTVSDYLAENKIENSRIQKLLKISSLDYQRTNRINHATKLLIKKLEQEEYSSLRKELKSYGLAFRLNLNKQNNNKIIWANHKKD